MTSQQLKSEIISFAKSLGFARVGVTNAEPMSREGDFLRRWIDDGHAGEMTYLEDHPGLRSRPGDLLAGARSVIALAMNYYNERTEDSGIPSEGRTARYAWGKDYHRVIRKRLASLVRFITMLSPGVRCKTFVDTGPLLERALAQRAGLGFIGKNTMLITRGLGSWVLLAHVLTSLDLPPDAPDTGSCGACTRCIDVCPTQAICSPYLLEARRCIAYLTIESDQATPEALRTLTGEWLFGCDICQEVCPHNARVQATSVSELQPSAGLGSRISLAGILALSTEEAFHQWFAGTSLARAGRHGLIRNACLAAAHLGRQDLVPQLQTLARNDPHPVVREHARWAAAHLSGTKVLA